MLRAAMAPPTMTPTDTLARVYNKFVIDLAINLKAHSPTLKRALKARYRAIDPDSPSHIAAAAASLNVKAMLEAEPAALLAASAVLAFEPLKGLKLGEFAADFVAGEGEGEGESDGEGKPLAALRSYVYILASLAATYVECEAAAAGGEVGEAGDGGAGALVTQVLEVLGRAQRGTSGAPDPEAEDAKASIIDDDIVALLSRVEDACAERRPAAEGGGKPDDAAVEEALRSMEKSKIGGLAKEISSEIDITKLQMDNPMEMLNFANLTDSSSVLGNIVSKVGSKIQSKLQSGELKQEELLGEAMSLLKLFDGNKMGGMGGMADIMKAAAATGAGGGARAHVDTAALRTHATRDRLRAKLDAQRR